MREAALVSSTISDEDDRLELLWAVRLLCDFPFWELHFNKDSIKFEHIQKRSLQDDEDIEKQVM